tara:strand:+ start:653 stop:1066 length:414 start_codon:yes stop_codon:yes gene_type:complete
MSNTYSICRLEPQCDCGEGVDAVCSVVIGVNATSECGNHSGYVDGVYSFGETKPTLAEFNNTIGTIANQYIADQGWQSQLDSQIEASKLRPIGPPDDWERPNVTVDMSVEAAVGSPANPAPAEEESSEETSEEESSE